MTFARSSEIRDIGSRVELLVDDYLIDTLDQLTHKLHAPVRLPQTDDAIAGSYVTIIQDGPIFRRYYRDVRASYDGERFDGHPGEFTAYLESRDGVHWNKPVLGQIEVDGTRNNNVILAEAPFCHNFAPFLDKNPNAAAERRFKALAGTHPGGGLVAWASPDGIHWKKMAENPVITSEDFAFDSQNISFWSLPEQCYVCYFRSWETSHGRLRTISRTTSDDFLHWSEPVAMDPNFPGEHLYASATHPYFRAPHIYIALATRFLPERGNSTDIMLLTSRGGNRFDRHFKEAFIRPGLNPERWGNRSNYAVPAVIPTSPTEMSIYLSSGRVKAQRCVLRIDGFASIHASEVAGELRTHPVRFRGDSLVINYSTSAAGEIRVALMTPQGEPIPGFAQSDCLPIVGDEIERTVQWKSGKNIGKFQRQPIRLKFYLKEADLFSIRFK